MKLPMLVRARKAVLLAITALLASCDSGEQTPLVINPVDLTRHDVCFVDGMLLMEHPGPKGQIITKTGEVINFCDTREFFASLFEPESKSRNRFSYVQDFAGIEWGSYNNRWLDAASAWYVLGSRQHGAMGPTIIPFGNPDSAHAFVDKNGGTVFAFSEITQEVLDQFFRQVREDFRNEQSHDHGHDHKM